MVDYRAVIFLAGSDASAHLKKHDSVRAVGDCLIAPKAHYAGALQGVVRKPVGDARSLFHKSEGFPVLDSSHRVMLHRRQRVRVVGRRVIVP